MKVTVNLPNLVPGVEVEVAHPFESAERDADGIDRRTFVTLGLFKNGETTEIDDSNLKGQGLLPVDITVGEPLSYEQTVQAWQAVADAHAQTAKDLVAKAATTEGTK